MTFGEELGWGSSVEESQQIIDRFIELGGNFIDTANFYTKSHSEPVFPSIHKGGTTVNGVYGPTSSFVLEKGEKPY